MQRSDLFASFQFRLWIWCQWRPLPIHRSLVVSSSFSPHTELVCTSCAAFPLGSDSPLIVLCDAWWWQRLIQSDLSFVWTANAWPGSQRTPWARRDPFAGTWPHLDIWPRRFLRIRLIQLPPYCPHLNPIERLWAVMHEYVTHNRFYPTQKEFADAILAFLREIIPKQWHKFRDKVTDNFRIISNQNTRILAWDEYIIAWILAHIIQYFDWISIIFLYVSTW